MLSKLEKIDQKVGEYGKAILAIIEQLKKFKSGGNDSGGGSNLDDSIKTDGVAKKNTLAGGLKELKAFGQAVGAGIKGDRDGVKKAENSLKIEGFKEKTGALKAGLENLQGQFMDYQSKNKKDTDAPVDPDIVKNISKVAK